MHGRVEAWSHVPLASHSPLVGRVVWMHGRKFRSLVPPPWSGGSISEGQRPVIEAGRVDLVGRVDFGSQATSNRGRQGRFRKSKGGLEASRAIKKRIEQKHMLAEKRVFGNRSNVSQLICEVAKRW